MNGLYQDNVLSNPEVCNNCYRRIREPRAVREHLRSDVTVGQAQTGRVRTTTTVEHVPDELPTDDRVTFCECGADGAFDRPRSKWEVDDVRTYAKTLSRTLDSLGVDHDRKTFFEQAIQRHEFDDRHYQTDEILAAALKTAVAVTNAST